MKRLSLTREFLRIFLPLALLLVLVGTGFYVVQYQAHLQDIRKGETALVQREQRIFQADLGAYISDSLFVAAICKKELLDQYDYSAALRHLSEALYSFAVHKPVYDQLRLLDATGQETIRVQLSGLGYEILPSAMLQNKAGRYYFTDAKDLQQGQVALSRFDLNMEHGAIELPRKPMIRFSSPVRDSNGDLLGVVVLNFLGDRLLNRIRRPEACSHDCLYLLDQQGYWLVGPEAHLEWGFMFRTGADNTFQARYPEAWERMQMEAEGQFLLHGDLFTFAWATDQGDRYSPAAATALRADYDRWCVASRLDKADLRPGWIPVYNGLGAFMLCISALVSFLLARARMHRARAQRELQRSEQRFRDVVAAVSEFIFELDPEGRFTFLTEDAAQIYGLAVDELLGTTPLDRAVLEDDLEEEGFREVLTWPKGFNDLEHQIQRPDGSRGWLSLSGSPMHDEDGLPLGFRGAGRDITLRKQDETRIREREETIRAMSRASADAIIMIDHEGRTTFWNPAAQRIFGYNEEEALGRKIHALLAPDDYRDKASLALPAFAVNGRGALVDKTTEVTALRKDGSTLPVEISMSSFRLGGHWCAVAVIRDITRRLEAQQKLVSLATTDELTGLANRRHFMERGRSEVDRCRRYKRPLALIMFDLDHFKSVNDTYGHDAGDQVLRLLSAASRGALREVDLLGRLGGEEFAALLPETDSRAAREVAERLRLTIEQTDIPVADAPDGVLHVTASLGVTCHDQGDLPTLEDLLKAADLALYQAKENGRNQVACTIDQAGTS